MKTQGLASTRNVGTALLAVLLVGFLSVIGITLVFQHLAEEQDAQIQNQRSRLFIGEQIVNTIGRMERLFLMLAQSDNEAMYSRIARQIDETAEQMEHYLRVLEHGGTVREALALNLFGMDEMVRQVTYTPPPGQQLVLEVIEMAPFVDRSREHARKLADLLRERDRCLQQEQPCIREASAEVRQFYKALPSFFYRFVENANRQFYEAVNELSRVEDNLARQDRAFHRSQWTLVLLVLVSVMALAVFFIRRINAAQLHLEVARAKAEAANLAKSRFLATMSHEIRTPMNGILGMAQVLETQELDDAQRKGCIRILLDSGHTLLRLLNDVLDLSKVEAGKLELHPVSSAPVALARETATLFTESAHRKGLRLHVNTTLSADRRYLVDPIRLRQMLSNLLSNAIKFTASGEVAVELNEVPTQAGAVWLEFAVTDTGMGIPQEKQALLFQSFSQVDSSRTRSFGGTGLGLSIVRQLTELMGGEVGVRSVVGQGSRFWFRLPLEPTWGPTVNPGDSAAMPLDAAVTKPVDAMGRPPTPSATTGRLSGRVLVAEDYPANRTVLEMTLKKLGVSIVMVGDGRQAVDLIAAGEVFDCILMDMQMPVMDGLEATREIRRWELAQGRPRQVIVACTANAYDDDRRVCIEAGMDDFLAKPILSAELRRMLGKWLPVSPDAESPTVQQAAEIQGADQLSTRPLDEIQALAILRRLLPLVREQLFDALAVFEELRRCAEGTPLEAEVHNIGLLLANLHFAATAEALCRLNVFGWDGQAAGQDSMR
jgi:signal transduction histidine kinase/DNA-binding response OmpR family regulator